MRYDPFFQDTPIKALEMNGESIDFPILYYDLRPVTAMFTAKTERLKKLLQVAKRNRESLDDE